MRQGMNLKSVAVFGVGYVGSVTAACLARDGHRVIGVDVDAEKVADLNAGRAPVAEPGLDELIRDQVRAGRLRATGDVAEAIRGSEVALVAVGTPSTDDGAINTRAVEAVIEEIGTALRESAKPYQVVLRSTLLPGILEEWLTPILRRSSGRELGSDLHLANNPEFLREGSALLDYAEPPFVLVGAANEAAAQAVLELYRGVVGRRIVTDTRTAALVKYASNAWHAVKVAFANEVGTLARSWGIDGLAAMDIVCADQKLNISPAYLRPGFAFGGSCLPKDLRALLEYSARHGIDLDLLAAALDSNDVHIGRALRLVRETGLRRVGLVGLSFKPGTDDLRESPLVALARMLLQDGFDLRIYDAAIKVDRLRGHNRSYIQHNLPQLAALLVQSPLELTRHAELLVLGTDATNAGTEWLAGFGGPVIDLHHALVRPDP